jgi:hypothetical protein
MCPVLEDATLAEKPRHGFPRIRTDARAERDPMASLDGGDRVELNAREGANRGFDLAS